MPARLRIIGSTALTIALASCGGVQAPGPVVGNAPAIAAPAPGNPFYYARNVRRACPVAQAPDEMECLALVRTDIPATKPGSTPKGYGPSDIQSAYNLPSATAGSGQIVAIVDAFDNPNEENDLAVYRSTYGLPPCGSSDSCFQKVNEQGQAYDYPPPDQSWGLEESLDVDMVSAACPKCRIVLVEANSSLIADMGKSVDTAVSVMHANVVSNSYIHYNVRGTKGRQFYVHPGRIITAAAGDEGYKVGEPAGFESVVSVGGTALTKTTTGRKWSEAVWGGTGSGCVLSRPKPAWQTNHACKYRAMNDVAAIAAPYTGVAFYDTYNYDGWQVGGGTSTATPIIASVYALAGNETKLHAAESLYAKGASLYDVTSGQNGMKCATHHHPRLCAAAPGWDGPTGNGTPNGIGAF